ncbi:MAG TPA: DUF1330 domain-containing protein [Candidatus Binatia bacterium]|jgi:hypothetical protein
MAIYPEPEQFQALMAGDDGKPVVMLNLLRFKPRADPPHEGMSGEEAYELYGREMVPFVVSRGGRLIWSGRVKSQVIGTGGEEFHSVALVEYPSRKAFVEIAMDPYVAGIGKHRAAGLEMQWLLATEAMQIPS